MDADQRAAAITILLGAAETSDEYDALARVALRAGFLWRCSQCRQDQYANRRRCWCGVARPADFES